MHPFRLAVEAHDLDALRGLLAEDVEFRSPIVYKPYRGRAAVSELLAAVSQVIEDWTCVREIGAPESADHAIVFQAKVGEKELEGCDFMHHDENGSIDELYVMVRPLSGAIALAQAMQEKLAGTT